MNKNSQDDFRCSQFEAALAEALDDADADAGGTTGAGGPERLPLGVRQAFEAHRVSCPACGPLYAEAIAGLRLLRSLEEVEPPRHLVHNILAATSRAETQTTSPARGEVPTSWLKRLFHDAGPRVGGLLHSRFVASFCMAFFSLSLTLSLSGVRVGDLTKIDWRPNALRKSVVLQYTQIEARVMRYYDNMRLVYEVQSRVQKLKQVAAPVQNPDHNHPQQQNRKHAPGAGRPEPEENYSQERNGSLIARLMKNEGAQI
jgi:hypothetical protein